MKITKSIELGLVNAGRKGVTNKQMLEAFKKDLTNEQLIQLLNDYSSVFMASVKYTPDAKKVALEKLVNENGYPKFTVKTGKKIRMDMEESVKIIVLNDYKNKNNAKMAAVIKNIGILTEDEKVIVEQMVKSDLGISEIAKLHGLTKDQAYNRIFRSKNSIYNKLTAAI